VDQAASYFLTTTLKGYAISPHSKWSKNMIDVVFHKSGMSPEFGKPVMMLELGGKALQVRLKASECLYLDKQVTSQGIPMDSAHYMGYAEAMDCMHQAKVTAINGYHRGAPQVIHLDQECTGNPKTYRWSILTNNEVFWEDCNHVQFNSMFVTTRKVAKNRHTIALGPKFAGIAQFGNITNRGGGGGGGIGGGGSGGGRGKWCLPPPKMDNDLSSNDLDDE
jgi:hypothetical protein